MGSTTRTAGATTASKDTQTIVTELNAGWYNYLSQAMGITDPTFQLAQGCLGLQTSDSSGLFLMSDAMPASAAVNFYSPNGLSKRSSAYRMLLSALLPETGSGFSAILGDMYATWILYRNAWFTNNPTTPLTQLQLFTQFANQRLDPGMAQQGIAIFKLAANAPLNQALDAMASAASQQTFMDSAQSYNLFKYSAVAAGALNAINSGAAIADLNFDSTSMDTTLQHTTIQGSASGFYDFFTGGASGSLDQINTKAAGTGFTIKGYVNKYATLTTDPINWFTSSEYLRAYEAQNDNSIWDPQATAGGWPSFFTPATGQLARRVSALMLVSDYKITVTSKASYSQSDYQQTKLAAEFGMWPFFSASASSTSTTEVKLNSDSTLSVVHSLNKGLIQIWGVFTANAPQ